MVYTGVEVMAKRVKGWVGVMMLGAVVACAGMPGRAMAWGRLGHRAAAKVTEGRLTPEALAGVRAILNPGETLAEASTWADEVRRDIPESGPWHYVNVPITENRYDAKFCGEKGCVVEKTKEFRKVLADPTVSKEERRKALRFLTHFVQDMHQPVHVGERGDRGGNNTQVQFFGKGSNLHRVWDSGLIERVYQEEEALAGDLSALIAAEKGESWGSGSEEDWATESLIAAKGAYEAAGQGRALKKGEKLGDAYQEANFPVAKRRLAQSAVRLAWVLNEVFAAK